MIQTNCDYIEQEKIQKYVSVIRHFRGYLDKERYEDDIAFLAHFVQEVGCNCRRETVGEKSAD